MNPLYKEYLTTIECEGSLSNLLAFMDALEASDFLFRIMSYSMTPKSKTGEVVTGYIKISRILITAEKIAIPDYVPQAEEEPAPIHDTMTDAVTEAPIEVPMDAASETATGL